jgi:hypothetical protein
MEHFDHRSNQKPPLPANLQALSIYYRQLFCRTCRLQVNVCNSCDRGQIYCEECKPVQKRERIRKAHNKYKKSRNGKILRAASAQRRRDKIKLNREVQNFPEFPRPPKIEGDRGLTFPQVSNTTPEPAISAEQKTKGVFEDVQFPNPIFNSSTSKSQRSPRKTTQIICTFCRRTCSPFQRQKTGRMGTKEKKDFRRWRARSRGKDP